MLYYFFSTRICRNPSQIVLFLVQFAVPIVILTNWQNDGLAFLHTPSAISILSLFLIYEVGYLYNDFFDNHGARLKSKWPKSQPSAIVLIAINISLVLALYPFSISSFWQSLTLVAILGVFALHTYLAPQNRTATFSALNLLKISFVGSVATEANLAEVLVIAAAITLPQSWKYWSTKTKRGFVPSNWLGMALSLTFVFLVTMDIAALVALVLLLCLFIISVQRKVSAARLRQTSIVSHAHTDASHDATITVADYSTIPHHVFLTDHAEDVEPKSFLAITEKAAKFPGKFTTGLEYPWASEHILAIGLTDPQLHPIPSLNSISEHCKELIWAHPNPALRRLLGDAIYRRKIWHIFEVVDSVEWSNIKMLRRRHKFSFRMMAWAALFHFVKGAKVFYIGQDVHHLRDIETLRAPDKRETSPGGKRVIHHETQDLQQ